MLCCAAVPVLACACACACACTCACACACACARRVRNRTLLCAASPVCSCLLLCLALLHHRGAIAGYIMGWSLSRLHEQVIVCVHTFMYCNWSGWPCYQRECMIVLIWVEYSGSGLSKVIWGAITLMIDRLYEVHALYVLLSERCLLYMSYCLSYCLELITL
jgi:hypothetical protein